MYFPHDYIHNSFFYREIFILIFLQKPYFIPNIFSFFFINISLINDLSSHDDRQVRMILWVNNAINNFRKSKHKK